MRLGVGDAFVGEPGVELVVVFEPEPRREEALAHQPNLVLDLTLLPARRWRAGNARLTALVDENSNTKASRRLPALHPFD